MAKKIKREQTVGEEIGNAITHGVMAIFGIFILIYCLIHSHNWQQYLGSTIYGLSVVFLFTFSCLYHAITHKFTKTVIFKRFDHISIYLLIGGTYAPILLNLPTIQWPIGVLPAGLVIFIIQWGLIAIGIIAKSIWLNKYHWLHLIIYLALGWTAVFFAKDVFEFNLTFLILIFLGGLFYSFGVIFYINHKVKWFHFVWHIFVNIACILHSIAIILFIF
ncbi:MAG: hemolysin III family protein [Mycoplasmataceae bacterium]|nr:hemolysin III family protein [Mycoplasmataceae bacterium]